MVIGRREHNKARHARQRPEGKIQSFSASGAWSLAKLFAVEDGGGAAGVVGGAAAAGLEAESFVELAGGVVVFFDFEENFVDAGLV